MKFIILMILCGITRFAFAQTDEQLQTGHEGLPRVYSGNEEKKDGDDQRVPRAHIPGTLNRRYESNVAPFEYRSQFEKEPTGHFDSDTTQVYFFDEEGKPFRDPYRVYEDSTPAAEVPDPGFEITDELDGLDELSD